MAFKERLRTPSPTKIRENTFHSFMSTLKNNDLRMTPQPRELVIRGGSYQGLPLGPLDTFHQTPKMTVPQSTKAKCGKPPLAMKKKKHEPNFDYFMDKLKEKREKAKERREIATKFRSNIERFNRYSSEKPIQSHKERLNSSIKDEFTKAQGI